ncbi:nitrite/sulfite reductase [Sphingomonas carotinifaciens]|uniref:Nitrite/sulfite reductase n=1 Tax=Sphingomonas carotinifaciens TaxID=1166323 RepID=A0A1G7KDT9_9SPHN|nr:nitrite/sulfite reductase [Sphingomonas carotinifaciens]MBB4085235.1 sulfite reductase (NADPH) hemoprotein beta-component [Sphingomonas carotinifaciens]MWC43740.1 nitrite/sulfite reductase [Sphingomonas carotinifaciens]SDF35438.1 sulfite reductase (NADPH) hemoprotein beta-component [Sphingomonas carotinifaciens]
MYQYDEYDQSIVDARVEEFRDQVERRLSGAMTEDQFKPLRLMNGLYLQLHAYMLRIAVPYGTLDARQMRMLGHIARKYDRGYGHFTTRQNIQFNWIKLADAPDILAELATVQMHAIQTSGNCIRNISSDQFAGAAADEVTDPRPWAELIRQWSTFHPEFTYLPRKFKIAVIAADEDRAAMRLHDIGIQLLERDGQLGAKIFVGGGMGRTPMIAHEVKDFITADHLMSYLEACLRVYNRYGRRDNIYKARIKILLHEIGPDEYRRQVEEEFAQIRDLGIDPPVAELERISAMFAAPAFAADAPDMVDRSDPDFAVWLDQNVSAHKQPSHAVVTISLKPIGGIPGDASADQIDLMADLAERYSFDELRVTHAQNIVLPHVRKADLYAIWQQLRDAGLAEANLDLISDIIACPGLDYCSLANARSIPLAQKIGVRFSGRERDLGELKLKISGCINACGHHHAGHIGILGVDKKGTENYQLLLGGSGAEDVSLGKITGPGFDEDGVVDAIERVTDRYIAVREEGERFLDTYRRVGMQPFKEAIYG